MIPALIEATSLSLSAGTVADDLPRHQVRDRFAPKSVLAPLRFIAIFLGADPGHAQKSASECIVQSAHTMTLLEELQARLLAKAGSEAASTTPHNPEASSPQAREPIVTVPNAVPDLCTIGSDNSSTEGE